LREYADIALTLAGRALDSCHWIIGHEIRDVAVAPDGAVWLLINSMQGALLRLTPKQR
jgi:glucose/arabinose dehydrogenase